MLYIICDALLTNRYGNKWLMALLLLLLLFDVCADAHLISITTTLLLNRRNYISIIICPLYILFVGSYYYSPYNIQQKHPTGAQKVFFASILLCITVYFSWCFRFRLRFTWLFRLWLWKEKNKKKYKLLLFVVCSCVLLSYVAPNKMQFAAFVHTLTSNRYRCIQTNKKQSVAFRLANRWRRQVFIMYTRRSIIIFSLLYI